MHSLWQTSLVARKALSSRGARRRARRASAPLAQLLPPLCLPVLRRPCCLSTLLTSCSVFMLMHMLALAEAQSIKAGDKLLGERFAFCIVVDGVRLQLRAAVAVLFSQLAGPFVLSQLISVHAVLIVHAELFDKSFAWRFAACEVCRLVRCWLVLLRLVLRCMLRVLLLCLAAEQSCIWARSFVLCLVSEQTSDVLHVACRLHRAWQLVCVLLLLYLRRHWLCMRVHMRMRLRCYLRCFMLRCRELRSCLLYDCS